MALVRCDIVVYDGLDELDALGPLEVLRSTGMFGPELTGRLRAHLAEEHDESPDAEEIAELVDGEAYEALDS